MVSNNKKPRQAFSLVELMVAVGIVSILTSLGLSRYQAFVARGRMAEAKVNLGHIASLQGIYRAEWNEYAEGVSVGKVGGTHKCSDNDFKNKLGFAPDGCESLRYGYESSGKTTFTAEAKAEAGDIYTNCNRTEKDTWEVTSTTLKVKQTVNIVKYCD